MKSRRCIVVFLPGSGYSVIEGRGRGGPDMVVSFGEGCRLHRCVVGMRTSSCVGAVGVVRKSAACNCHVRLCCEALVGCAMTQRTLSTSQVSFMPNNREKDLLLHVVALELRPHLVSFCS